VYTFTVPYAAIQLTLYYFDLEAQGLADTGIEAPLIERPARVPGTLGPGY
jgi:hypothetical protein